MLKLYTDGACTHNGYADAVAAWAWAIYNERDKLVATDGQPIFANATNNVAEMMAIYQGLSHIRTTYPINSEILVISDSYYCINAIEQWCAKWESFGWYRNKAQTLEVKNKDLWIKLYSLTKELKNVKFQWVRGHNGDVGNEFVDKKATKLSQEGYKTRSNNQPWILTK